jgi:1-deoxy-D-xylulose-5-phosphate reductoisomerase
MPSIGDRPSPRTSLRIVVLGSTGSIGRQTLDVVTRLRAEGRRIEVVALSAGLNVRLLSAQIETFAPRAASLAREDDAEALRKKHPTTRVLSGAEGLRRLAATEDADVVVNGLVGAVGLAPTLEALERRGRTVALANKESLVIGGELVRRTLADRGGRLLPLDSEHSGLRQCLDGGRAEDVARLVLTASGGPFLRTPLAELARVSAADALAHPNWSMGSRITVDSASMVNKAFEVIEARYLFGVPYEAIDVVVHPESVVHAMVEFRDGSVLAQLATHDMRIPIQYALTYPERVGTDLPRLSFANPRDFRFEPIDGDRFPAFSIVLEAARRGGSAPAAVNAADEVLVARFLRSEIPFTAIPLGLRQILDRWRSETSGDASSLEAVLRVDEWARQSASTLEFRA